MSIYFDEAALLTYLDTDYGVSVATADLARDALLEIAKDYLEARGRYPGWPTRNPPPGPPYMRTEQFKESLSLDIVGDDVLLFESSAVTRATLKGRTRRGGSAFPYGEHLLDQGYEVLPPDFYDLA
jgi:hypothetical protein